MFPLDILFPEVGLLDQKAVPFLILGGISILLSTVAAPICIPPVVQKGSPFSTSLPALAHVAWGKALTGWGGGWEVFNS